MEGKLNTTIESLGIYLPPEVKTTSEILNECTNTIRFPLEQLSGISTRRMAGETEYSLDLSIKAVEDCLQNSRYTPNDIDLLICCNISRYDGPSRVSFEPSTSLRLKGYFNFENAVAFDITNACAGLFTGIFLADALIQAGAFRNVLLVSGEYITHLAKTAQKEITNFMDSQMACLTLGDAGAAIILEKAARQGIGFERIELQTLGAFSNYCLAKPSTHEHGGYVMLTDSVKLTSSALNPCARHSIDILNESNWSTASFNHLIMHQTSTLTMKGASKEINRILNANVSNDDNTINNLKERGNTASTSHMLATYDHILGKRINENDRIVFSINASGLTIGTALYVMDELPDRIRNGKRYKEKLADRAAHQSNQKVRIESIGTHIDKDLDSLERLTLSALECLSNSIYEVDQIEVLIYCGVYRTEYLVEPAIAALLAGKLKMNAAQYECKGKKTLAFDVFNGALGFMNALAIAKDLVQGNKVKTVMIVASEEENNRIDFPDDLLEIEEASSAVIVDKGNVGFNDIRFGYNIKSDFYETYWTNKSAKSHLNIVKNQNLEDLYFKSISDLVSKYLSARKLSISDIDLLIPPQISPDFIERMCQELKYPMEKTVDVSENTKDLFTSSIPFAMEFLKQRGQAKEGVKALMILVGSGVQSACTIYEF